MNAVADRRIDEVASLLRQGKDPNSHSAGKSALHLTLHGGSTTCRSNPPDPALFRLLLSSGANPNLMWPAQYGYSGNDNALHAATRVRNVEILRMAVNAGVPINSRTTDGATALIVATFDANEEIIRVLLEAGADPNLLTVNSNGSAVGISALHGAARRPGSNNVIARLLITHGAKYQVTPLGGPLEQLSRFYQGPVDGIDSLVELLLKAGGNPNEVRDKAFPMDTPLNMGLDSSHTSHEVLEALLKAGADPNRGALYSLAHRLDYENIPLKRKKVLELLLKHGARVKLTGPCGRPCDNQGLMEYAEKNNPAYARELRALAGE